MTPLQLAMIIHYHMSPEPYAQHDPDHAYSPAVHEQRESLIKQGLLSIGANPHEFSLTEKGEAFIDHLCAVKIPICKWVQP